MALRFVSVWASSAIWYSTAGATTSSRRRRFTRPCLPSWPRVPFDTSRSSSTGSRCGRREYWLEYLGRLAGRLGWLAQRITARSRHEALCFSRLHARRLEQLGHRGGITLVEGLTVMPEEDPVTGPRRAARRLRRPAHPREAGARSRPGRRAGARAYPGAAGRDLRRRPRPGRGSPADRERWASTEPSRLPASQRRTRCRGRCGGRCATSSPRAGRGTGSWSSRRRHSERPRSSSRARQRGSRARGRRRERRRGPVGRAAGARRRHPPSARGGA